MSEKSYFITFLYFDTEHQRSNILSHLSIAILEGEKNAVLHLTNLRLLNAYGYYSHRIPEMAEKTLWETFLNFLGVTFRIQGSYAEFKHEDLTNIDLGFGVLGGPIIEITAEEKATIEANIQAITANEAQFFGEDDLKATQAVENLNLTDPVMKHEKFIELRNYYRELHYKSECKHINAMEADDPYDLMFENTALESGLISPQRYQQEKLKMLKRIEFFDFWFSPQDQTCKSLGINFLIACLSNEPPNNIRKIILSELMMEGFYTHAIPRSTSERSKMIFNSVQSHYSATEGKPALPNRTWDKEDVRCSLIYFEENSYIDLTGKRHALQPMADKDKYVPLLENLMHLKRLLNDFCVEITNSQLYLSIIDQAITKMANDASDTRRMILFYHDTIRTLQKLHCFDNISKDIFKSAQALDSIKKIETAVKEQDLRLEDGVRAEIHRLYKIRRHVDLSVLYKELFHQPRIHFPFLSFFSKETAKTKADGNEIYNMKQTGDSTLSCK